MTNKNFLSDISSIRARARQHIRDGAVTGGYGGDRETVLRLLNEALATEIVCTLRYRRHYFMADGILGESIKKEFLVHANEEQGHADEIAERIIQLGGEPNFDPATLTSRSHAEYVEGNSLEEMIKEDLVAERVAIESYREMIEYMATNDPTTRRMLEGILAKEEEHAEELASMITDVRQLVGKSERTGVGAGAANGHGSRPESSSAKATKRTENAIKDPTKVFSSPDDVLGDDSLSIDEKRRILSSWIKDAELLATASAENMTGGEQPRLRESKLALAALDLPSAH